MAAMTVMVAPNSCSATRNLEALMGDEVPDVLAIYHLKFGGGAADSASIGSDIVGRHDNTLPRSYSDFLARKTCNEALAAKVTRLGLRPTGYGTWRDATLVEQHVYRVFMACGMDVMRAADELRVLFEDEEGDEEEDDEEEEDKEDD